VEAVDTRALTAGCEANAVETKRDAPRGGLLNAELVEGPTLADRIAKGAIPLDEALSIAKQIAEAACSRPGRDQ